MNNHRLIISFVLGVALITSCHSNKEVQQSIEEQTDSVTTVTQHRTIINIDSVYRHFNLTFDTLSITVERPFADTTEVVRLKAVKGQVNNVAAQNKLAVEHKSRLDSTALKQSSNDSLAEHTASTAVYQPPNMTNIICYAIAILAVVFCLLYRKKS